MEGIKCIINGTGERTQHREEVRAFLRYLVTAIGRPINFKTMMARPRLQSTPPLPPPLSPPGDNYVRPNRYRFVWVLLYAWTQEKGKSNIMARTEQTSCQIILHQYFVVKLKSQSFLGRYGATPCAVTRAQQQSAVSTACCSLLCAFIDMMLPCVIIPARRHVRTAVFCGFFLYCCTGIVGAV